MIVLSVFFMAWPLMWAEERPGKVSPSYAGWQHSGSLFIITTPEGANLPATASEEGFPLLVRLNKDFFDFKQAKANGEDVRFTSGDGTPLAYQIEEWDATAGMASIWVRVPTIKGNARQEIKIHWGKSDAANESSGKAVFNDSNGYSSVWHLNDSMKDEVGATTPTNNGTTAMAGIIGKCAHFKTGQLINCGESIATYPTGANPSTTEVWFKPDTVNVNILGWGVERGEEMIQMILLSPRSITMDCFSSNNITGSTILPSSEWVHVVYAYQDGNSRLYVNGMLDSTNAANGSMKMPNKVKLYLGGWHGGPVAGFNFSGDMDEVRISKVTRSAEWVKMEYENQKLLQTMVGPIIKTGNQFSVSGAAGIFAQRDENLVARVAWVFSGGGHKYQFSVDDFGLAVFRRAV